MSIIKGELVEANSIMKMATGSYTGTGTGYGSTITLSFSFSPRLLIIGSTTFIYPEPLLYTNIQNTNMNPEATSVFKAGEAYQKGTLVDITWGVNTISWTIFCDDYYYNATTSTNGSLTDEEMARYFLNTEGISYKYICLGI